MKVLIRYFFKTLRLLLGPLLLLWEFIARPRAVERTAQEQARVDAQCRNLALYEFKTCPFCIRVRREMRRLALSIERRDAQHDPQHRAALLQGGGVIKVPCLQITDSQGKSQWLYESVAINAYLHKLAVAG